MKIAIIGIRGIPFAYSGFEVFAEELAIRMVKKGHQVTVYCRNDYFKKKPDHYKGVKLIYLPAVRTKYFETVIHSAISTLHGCFLGHYDVIYFLGVSNAYYTLLPRLFGIKTLINIDGLDWKREKWNFFGKSFLKSCEFMASLLPSAIITDSAYIKSYYFKEYGKNIRYFPYGFFEFVDKKTNLLKKFNLIKNKYFVWVGRFVPDNHLEEAIMAFRQLKTDYKLVVIGDDLYETRYKRHALDLIANDPRIILTGFIPHQECSYFMKNSLAYIETKRSGGTHPSLIDAMGVGCLIISNNHQANQSILKSNAFYYSINDPIDSLHQILETIQLEEKSPKVIAMRRKIRTEAQTDYSWTNIIKSYEDLLVNLIRPRYSR
jgi:glycosyltransferase involved in cell wall biosynthesis